MSIITDTFFGGAEKKAAKAQQKGIEKGIQTTKAAADQARGDLFRLFPAAQQNAQQGFQGALDVFSQSLPAQTQAFQQGNVGAQQQLLAGLPLMQNAILGGQIDYSQLQPYQVQTPDTGFFNQQLPEFVDPYAPQQTQQNTQNNTEFDLYRALGGNPLGNQTNQGYKQNMLANLLRGGR